MNYIVKEKPIVRKKNKNKFAACRTRAYRKFIIPSDEILTIKQQIKIHVMRGNHSI